MPIRFVGSQCARRDCRRPEWADGLCGHCRRLARLFGKDPGLFAYEPLGGYRDERDAVPLPWEHWEAEAGSRGWSLADLLGDRPHPDR